MIDLSTEIARAQLVAVRTRIEQQERAWEVAQGTFIPPDKYLLPKPGNNVRKAALERVLRQQQTLGPEVMDVLLGGAIGAVSWVGEDDEVPDDLERLDIRAMAERVARQLLVDGVSGLLAHEEERDGEPTGEFGITRLAGYLQPYYDLHNADRMTGLYQAYSVNVTTDATTITSRDTFGDRATSNPTKNPNRYHVRIYDWSDGPERAVIRIWERLQEPTNVGGPPTRTIENAPVPAVAVLGQTDDGLPLGPVTQALPLLLAAWTTDARLTLSEELAAFPMAVTKGRGDVEAIGPNEAIALDHDGDFYWSQPGNLEELRLQRDLRFERVRRALNLPGGILGNDSPSGDAIREANVRFKQANARLARIVGNVMTRAVEDHAENIGSDPASVVVNPSMEYEIGERIRTSIDAFAAGILPLDQASKAIQPYFPGWDDEERRAYVEDQSTRLTLGAARAALGDTGPDTGDVEAG